MLQIERLRGSLIPAVPVPFAQDGQVSLEAQRRYAEWMSRQPVEGVAVWAHTGRGLRLGEAGRSVVLKAWRNVLTPPRFVVAGAGASPELVRPDQVIMAARSVARQAFSLGADAVLVHPPAALRGRPDQDALVIEYHQAIAEIGPPLILFYLYERAGGISYHAETLKALLAMPAVIGIKVATLDSVMTFQDIAALIRTEAPGKVLVTGEDRFLGYSLMSGAEAALIGMGAACSRLQKELLLAYREGRFGRFMVLNRLVDDLARHTFVAPLEGYIQRMLLCLVHHGVLGPESAHDPWGPALEPAEIDALGACLRRIDLEFPSTAS